MKRLATTLLTALACLQLPVIDAAAQDGGRAWLALGDSYSSGEGIPGTPGKDSPENGHTVHGRDCRRATGNDTGAVAWSVGAFRDLSDELDLDTIALVACTAAVTGELSSQIDEAGESHGRDRWDLVTLSIGGNDVRFAEVLKGCLDANSLWGAFDLTPGCDVTEAQLRQRVDDLRETLADTYDLIADRAAAGGDVVVLGYPQIAEEVARWDVWRRKVLGNCEGLWDYDIGMLRSAAGYLNQQTALAVQEADARHRDTGVRFHFLDISADPYEYSAKRTDRHALCADTPWLNGVTVGVRSGDWWELDRSFHPNQVGHTNTARVLTKFIRGHVTFDDGYCTTAELADDLGEPRAMVAVLDDCTDGWAYVDLYANCGNECGDNEVLARHENGKWATFTFLPTSMCAEELLAAGAPSDLLDNLWFPPCAPEPDPPPRPAPPPPAPAGACGTVTSAFGGPVLVYAEGAVSCAEAIDVVDRYNNDPTLIPEGSSGYADVGEWGCASTSGTHTEMTGEAGSCHRGSDNARILIRTR